MAEKRGRRPSQPHHHRPAVARTTHAGTSLPSATLASESDPHTPAAAETAAHRGQGGADLPPGQETKATPPDLGAKQIEAAPAAAGHEQQQPDEAHHVVGQTPQCRHESPPPRRRAPRQPRRRRSTPPARAVTAERGRESPAAAVAGRGFARRARPGGGEGRGGRRGTRGPAARVCPRSLAGATRGKKISPR
nr:uncharacterized protein LOC127329587 [Lolium perenne]